MFESVILESSLIEVSELTSHPDYLQAKFVVSDFDTNKNGVRLNRDTIEEWMSTLVGSPLLGKIIKKFNKTEDFASHEMKIVSYKGEDGKTYKKAVFDTSAFGVFTDVAIEEIDGDEFIVATARVWKRFENACQIIKDRAESLKSSWEIATEKYTTAIENGEPVKIIDLGRFIGHCCLGAVVPPAYDSTAVLEVASEETDELNIALMEDLQNLNMSSNINLNDKEVEANMNENEVVETNVAEQTDVDVVEQVEQAEVVETSAEETAPETSEENVVAENQDEVEEETSEETETSALTDNDLRHKLSKAFEQADHNGHCTYGWIFMIFPADNTAWFRECGCCSDTELVEVKYSVENDNVVITERNAVSLTVSPREINKVIAQKDNAIVEMSNQIQTLNTTVANLQVYKDRIDEIEKAEREAKFEQDKKDLCAYAISSGYITQEEIETSEEIKGYINALDKVSIKSLISDRVVASLANKSEQVVETSASTVESEPSVQVNLMAEQSEKGSGTQNALKIMKAYLSK